MKRVVLLRHGESAAQLFSKGQRWEPRPELRDVYLSPQGEAQVHELRRTSGGECLACPPLVVCSPLSRAVQTATLLFPNAHVLAHPDLREASPRGKRGFEGVQQECRGRLRAELEQDARLSARRLDWSLLPAGEPWWCESVETLAEVQARLASFRRWLAARPEAGAVVVCHFKVIQTITAEKSLQVKNASPVCCLLDGAHCRPVSFPEVLAPRQWGAAAVDGPEAAAEVAAADHEAPGDSEEPERAEECAQEQGDRPMRRWGRGCSSRPGAT